MPDDRIRRTLRAEATLLRVPVFALAIKGSATLDGFEFRHVRKRGDATVESVIRTERDETCPYPGPLSRRAHMAVLSLVAERGFPFENPVSWTWRDLCRRMGLPNSGRRVGELKGALRATWGLKLFGLSVGDGRSRESWRRLYSDCEFQNEQRADGTTAEANRLWLAPWYLDSLNALHSAPVDHELWKRLDRVGPLASRLYEYLIPAFYKREVLELAYDRLASAMPVVAEARRSHAIRQFAPALAALAEEKVIAEAAWDAMKGSGRPKLRLVRGLLLGPPTATTSAAPSGMMVVVPEVSESSPFDPEAPARLAHEFYKLLGKPHQPLKSDLAVAIDLLTRFGEARSFERLPDAVKRLKARFRNAETMGALVRYFEESMRAFEANPPAPSPSRKAEPPRPDAITEAEAEDERLRALWQSLTDAERRAVRDVVLKRHPQFYRFPPLLEAACLQQLRQEWERTRETGLGGGAG